MADDRLRQLLEPTAGIRRTSLLKHVARIERFFGSLNNDLPGGAIVESTNRSSSQESKRQSFRNPQELNSKIRTQSSAHPPYRIGVVEAVPLECHIDNQPVDSPLWFCSLIECYSRLLMEACFTPQPRRDATTLQLLNQILNKSNWVPDVLFFRRNTDCPMVRIRSKLHACGELRVNGVAFLVAAPSTPRFVDVLHFPLDLSFAYVLIGDRWVLAVPKRCKAPMIAEERPDDLGPYFPM
jgi:hypothetical protein